jgi:hypothetical protein
MEIQRPASAVDLDLDDANRHGPEVGILADPLERPSTRPFTDRGGPARHGGTILAG